MFSVRFSVAEVSPVSMVAVQGRAVVMVVSCWPASVGAVVFLVSKLARGCVMCAKVFALLGLMWVRARKSAPCGLKTPQFRRFVARCASFVADRPEAPCWANFVAGEPERAR